ncbi:phage portal protein [endosymbiont 'TC1' of Trimyema compressum]|uniref:phage portal protein n=1 Tax=endosymbiont 'TC1' of Trimyema compressum TaxID=243899 RepID=UPI00139228E4|nr:phage portal protein [endosymbiont 'TC1' of Trimyema compressum]
MKILNQLRQSFKKEKRNNSKTISSEDIIAGLLTQKTDIAFSCYGGWNVLEIPSLMACLNKVSSTIGQIPLDIYLRTDKGKEKEVTSPLAYALSTRPNSGMTPSIFKKYIVNQMLIYGECFAKIIRNEVGTVKAIAPLRTGSITYTVTSDNGDFYYRYFNGKKLLNPLEAEDLLHFKDSLNNDGKQMSPITKLTDTIGMDKGMTKFLQEYLNNMVSPSFILEVESDLSMDKAKAIGDSFRKGIVGSHGAPLVIQKGLKAKEFNAKSLKDLDMSILIEKTNRNIVTALGCPLHTIGLEPFSKESDVAFFENTITPILTNIEEELNYKIFTKDELRKRFIRFNMKKKMRGNMAERIAYYTGLFQIGAITQNEIRALEDMNEVTGGDVPLILENYLPTEELKKQKKLDQSLNDSTQKDNTV